MKASLCVGEYCENAYNVEGLDIRVYSMEELCYCLKENAFLLDLVPADKLSDDNIMPEAFDPQVAEVVANAVKSHIR